MRLIIELPITELRITIPADLALLMVLVEFVNLLPSDRADSRLNCIPLDRYYRDLRLIENSKLLNLQQFLKLFNSSMYVENVIQLRPNLFEVTLS